MYTMETCNFTHFMQVLKPWLNSDYIRKAYVDAKGDLRLMFVDGGEKMFRIDDCSQSQLKDILQDLNKSGVPVEKYDAKLSEQSG
jgi:hypothetical protein